MHFPATQLLKREEVETCKIAGTSVIAAVHATGGACSRRAYVEAPFDLLYGFRGRDYDVEFLSPYEMLMHWTMVEVSPPTAKATRTRSEFTEQGLAYKQQCTQGSTVPRFEAGKHYVAVAAEDRLLLPEIPALGVLRHRWVWERRPRPYVPVWSFAKLSLIHI